MRGWIIGFMIGMVVGLGVMVLFNAIEIAKVVH
jgi:hypothetical protein